MRKLLILAFLAASHVFAVGLGGVLDFPNNTGSTISNYPIDEWARPFKKGDFPPGSFPKLVPCATTTGTYPNIVCASLGTAVATQVNVVNSFPSDSSIQFAHLRAIITSLPTGHNYYTFTTQAICNCGVDLALTPTQMLSTSSPNYDFDAKYILTQPYMNGAGSPGAVKTISARTILQNLFQGTVGAMGVADTSITFTVTNGTAPSPPFDIWVWNSGGGSPYSTERIRVTAVSGSSPNLTLTALRAWAGTTATTHANGDSAWHSILTYEAAGPIASTIRLFDEVSKTQDVGWQPINQASIPTTIASITIPAGGNGTSGCVSAAITSNTVTPNGSGLTATATVAGGVITSWTITAGGNFSAISSNVTVNAADYVGCSTAPKVTLATLTVIWNNSATLNNLGLGTGGFGSTANWTPGMLARMQISGIAGYAPNAATYIQWVTVTPTSSTAANVTAVNGYPSGATPASAICRSITSGVIWPDQWQDTANTNYHSFRPDLLVTFWPTPKKYHVIDFSGENSDSLAAQDLHYDLKLQIGCGGNCSAPAPVTVYQQTNIWHEYGQVWKISRYNDPAGTNTESYPSGTETVTIGKPFWDGDPTVSPFAPPPLLIDQDASYLTSTVALPNFDLTSTGAALGCSPITGRPGLCETNLVQGWDNGTDTEGSGTVPGTWVPSGITGTITAGGTTLTTNKTLNATSSISVLTPAWITVDTGANAEDMIVTSPNQLSGTSWTVIRAQNGTSAIAHTNVAVTLNHKIGDAGSYDKAAGTGGASEYSNFMVNWAVYYLYSQDPRMWFKTVRNAELAGSWAINFRGGDPQKRLLRSDCGGALCAANSGTELGNWISTADRKTFVSYAPYAATVVGDRITPPTITGAQYQSSNARTVCATGIGGWDVGYNHQPDPWSIVYVVTGNRFYRERFQAMSSSIAAYATGTASTATSAVNRGPTGDYNGISYLQDNNASVWLAREAGNGTFKFTGLAWYFAPDASAAKAKEVERLNDALAAFEGYHNIVSDGATGLPGGSLSAGINGVFQPAACPTTGIGPQQVWCWAHGNVGYNGTLKKVDLGIGTYATGQAANAWNGGNTEYYGDWKPARSLYNEVSSALNANTSSASWMPAHATSAPVWDCQASGALTGTPITPSVTTTARAMDSFSLISAAGNNGGHWQITIPSTTNLRVGDRYWNASVITQTSAAALGWTGLGTGTILTVDNGTQVTLSSTFSGSYTANTANFVPLSTTLAAGGCAALAATNGGFPKRLFIATAINASNQELFYVDSCPTSGGSQDVMSAAVTGSEAWGEIFFGNHYVMANLGRANELGFANARPALQWESKLYAGMLTSPSFNPWLIRAIYAPTVKSSDGRTLINNFSDFVAGYAPWYPFDSNNITGFGTNFDMHMDMAYGASSFCDPQIAGCPAGQTWMANNVKSGMQPYFAINKNSHPQDIMRWNILPRVIPCAVATTSLPQGSIGQIYSATLQASGNCTLPVTWSVSVGSLPSWATLTGSTGIISGTPDAAATTNFTVTATDSSVPANIPTQALSIVVSASLTITTTSPLTPGSINIAYTTTFNAANGTPAYTWAVTSGSVPGVTMASNGVFSGTPTQAGTFNFTVQVTDSVNSTASGAFQLVISPNIVISPGNLGDGDNGLAYSTTFTAVGGSAPYTWAVSAGALPSGLSLSSGGVLSGTPTVSGDFNFTVQVTDNNSAVGAQPYTLHLNPTLTITNSTPLNTGFLGIPISILLTQSGGEPPYSWDISSSSLPPGLLISNANDVGQIVGSPVKVGTYNFTIRVTDSLGQAATLAVTMSVAPSCANGSGKIKQHGKITTYCQ